MWTGNSSSSVSVKSLVDLALHHQSSEETTSTLAWKGVAPPRVQIFVWCVLKGRILTKVELRRRGLLGSEDNPICSLCDLEEEDSDHLLIGCQVARSLWTSLMNLLDISWVFNRTCVGSLESWFLSRLFSRVKLAWNTIPAVILWTIWKERNAKDFEGKTSDINELLQSAHWRLCVWLLSSKEFSGLKPSDFLSSWEGCMKGHRRIVRSSERWTPQNNQS